MRLTPCGCVWLLAYVPKNVLTDLLHRCNSLAAPCTSLHVSVLDGGRNAGPRRRSRRPVATPGVSDRYVTPVCRPVCRPAVLRLVDTRGSRRHDQRRFQNRGLPVRVRQSLTGIQNPVQTLTVLASERRSIALLLAQRLGRLDRQATPRGPQRRHQADYHHERRDQW